MGSDPSCELSAQGRAISTIISAFANSIINGITSGFLVAIITGWLSWFAVLRVLSGALISLHQAFPSKGYTQIPAAPPQYEEIVVEEQGLTPETACEGAADGSSCQVRNNEAWLVTDITVLGWIGWTYRAIYSPLVQILWIVENWTVASGSLKVVRGFCISVAAVGLTMDTKKRYADKLRDSKSMGGGEVACLLSNASTQAAPSVWA